MEKFYQKYFLETSSRPFCAYKELMEQATTLDKTCWDQSWKSSKFKKWLNFSSSKFSPLPPNINVESGQVLLLKA